MLSLPRLVPGFVCGSCAHGMPELALDSIDSLDVGRGNQTRVYGKGRALIEELNALAVHADLTYEHRWTIGELIVWDNRCILHRATAYDALTQGRVIRRCTVLGEVPA